MNRTKQNKYIYIKNMVCNRCVAAVVQLLEQVGIQYQAVQLGEVLLKEMPSAEQLAQLRAALDRMGFSLLDDSKSKMIEKIKTVIIEEIHYNDADKKHNLSAILSARLHRDYSYLSRLFSEVEGITIEKYAIHQKIEKIKELLAYDEISLNNIAFRLGYSSAAHLSAQFKKITGLTPSYFKKNRSLNRKPLDTV